MARPCSVCVHPDRAQIDAALIEGGSYRDIARQWRVSKDAVARHKPHVETAMAKAEEAREAEVASDAASLSVRLRELARLAQSICDEARQRGDLRLVLQSIDRLGKLLELEARIADRVEAQKLVVNINAFPVERLSEKDRAQLFGRLLESGAGIPVSALQRLILEEEGRGNEVTDL